MPPVPGPYLERDHPPRKEMEERYMMAEELLLILLSKKKKFQILDQNQKVLEYMHYMIIMDYTMWVRQTEV